MIVGSLVITSSKVVSEAGTKFVWLPAVNVPLKEFFTSRISLLAVIVAFARQNASECLFLASGKTLPISWLRTIKTSRP